MGFKTNDKAEILLLWKHRFWEKGISPSQFRKCQMRDIIEIMDIDNAYKSKKSRNNLVQQEIEKIKTW